MKTTPISPLFALFTLVGCSYTDKHHTYHSEYDTSMYETPHSEADISSGEVTTNPWVDTTEEFVSTFSDCYVFTKFNDSSTHDTLRGLK